MKNEQNNKTAHGKTHNDGEDDRRVIADMSGVENPYRLFPETDGIRKKLKSKRDKSYAFRTEPDLDLSKEEMRQLRRGAIGASLFCGLIFAGAFALFILFCVFVWFR